MMFFDQVLDDPDGKDSVERAKYIEHLFTCNCSLWAFFPDPEKRTRIRNTDFGFYI